MVDRRQARVGGHRDGGGGVVIGRLPGRMIATIGSDTQKVWATRLPGTRSNGRAVCCDPEEGRVFLEPGIWS
jgi:hypothetical protein